MMSDQTTTPDEPTLADGDGGDTEPPADGGSRRFKFPTALTVLALVLLVVWVASFFIPSGAYKIDPETGGPVPGSYHRLPNCGEHAVEPCVDKSLPAQFRLLWRAPPNGLYGVQSSKTQYVSADEEGFLYGSAQIFFF